MQFSPAPSNGGRTVAKRTEKWPDRYGTASRAVGRSYAEYMQEKVWETLGMEYDASVSLDDSRHRVAKSYGGITTCAIDLAKVGRLYLNMGNWNGQQIIDSAWVERASAGTI